MKIHPGIIELKGKLFITKEKTEIINGVMHQKLTPRENNGLQADLIPGLSFVLNGANLYYDIKDEMLINGIVGKVQYTNNIDGHECIFDDFMAQEFTLERDVTVIVSFRMHIFEGVEYQKYLAQGIFSHKIETLKSVRIFGVDSND